MRGITRVFAAAGSLAVALPLAAQSLAAQESYTVGGSDVAIYNLAGEVTVTGGRGDAVTVEVVRGGQEGSRLDVQVGDIRGRQTLRVIYPSDRVSYRSGRWSGNTSLRLHSDGTWGGSDGGSWLRDIMGGGGDRVQVRSRGGGLDAHANLRITVPEGQHVSVYLAVGRIEASNVNGRVLLDTHSGGVTARRMTGYLNVDTGSGSVEVDGMDGDLLVDTGSGSVQVTDVSGSEVVIDTGSGRVVAEAVAARRINIDTGSGGIRLRRSSARDIRLDTGSGSVEAELAGVIDRMIVDTGSGGVTLRLPSDLDATLEIDTGSGGINVDFPITVSHRSRNELRGTIGAGTGRIVVDTGSGGVRIRSQ
jgi:lia operon protein LiaG